tara:strand:+ start:4834 stop:6189 length:1356 start_codon:yes stop_codon:yes gene_type:complete
MKNFILIFIILTITSCSFDNKTGIWRDASNIPLEKDTTESINDNKSKNRYESIFIENEKYNEEKLPLNNSTLNIDAPITTKDWTQQYGSKTNNISNYSYTGFKTIVSKSRKLNKNSENKNIVFYKNNLITSDHKGKIFIYSIDLKKKLFKYDFYKKKYRNFKKEIYLAINKNILIAADNLGYIYAIDLNTKSLIWAKNYGIPFRSNIKIADKQILLANQDNVIYSLELTTGEKNWQYSTNLTFLKSDFINNFTIDELNKNLFFLNTSGEFYSINYKNKNINWVLNFRNSSLKGNTDLFLSQPIIQKKDILIISTEKGILSYDTINGIKNWSFSSDASTKPILTTHFLYLISKNNLLICLDNKTGSVLWSKNIYKNVTTKIVKKIGKLHDFKIVNNELSVYTRKGYLLTYNYKNGNFIETKRISKNGINSEVVFLNKGMFLIDNKSKLLKFN